MKKLIFSTLFVFALLTVFFSAHVNAEELGSRLIPGGTVELIADGKAVTKFQSEVPLPDGLLMVVEGNCVVQTGGVQLVARDKSVFALSEGPQHWNLTIKQGHVDFALRPDAKPVTFMTPHKTIESQQAIAPASTSGLVRGYVNVTDQDTQFVVTQGSLRTASATVGPRDVQKGQGVMLAVADGGIGPATAVTTTTISTTGFVIGGVVTAAIVTGAVVANVESGGDEESPK
jgi:hypothetical protein